MWVFQDIGTGNRIYNLRSVIDYVSNVNEHHNAAI